MLGLYARVVTLVILVVGVFGAAAPYFISSGSDVGFGLGVLLVVATIYTIYFLLGDIWNTKIIKRLRRRYQWSKNF